MEATGRSNNMFLRAVTARNNRWRHCSQKHDTFRTMLLAVGIYCTSVHINISCFLDREGLWVTSSGGLPVRGITCAGDYLFVVGGLPIRHWGVTCPAPGDYPLTPVLSG